ncbi:DNA sulfur modification protein DndB [Lysobacter enzymogenes]|uniref:DNA sulfur modification protein DndB n=1 Tax=Lysobacter enzymogenes TaxID=69 RepID=UPI0037482F23
MEANRYSFTAMRGIQAGKAFFVLLCPLKLVPKLFRFDDESVPPELRAQRILNRARVPQIARYIADNPQEYILSSLCASVDGEVEFEPVQEQGAMRNIGVLHIGMSSTILINDGQHRRAAIEEAIRERPDIGDESISVVLFADGGLIRSQQMFADLNVHATRPTRSIRLLYDHRDEFAQLTRDVMQKVPLFREFTDLEGTSLSNRTMKLFTFSSLHQAIGLLFDKPRCAPPPDYLPTTIAFWDEVIRNMPDWQAVQARKVNSSDLRRDYVHAHGIALQAIGSAGAQLLDEHPKDWKKKLVGLKQIDWSRSNIELWEGRALHAGKISKSALTVGLVANIVRQALGLELSQDALELERRISSSRGMRLDMRRVS